MPAARGSYLLVDANVLIDYVNTDRSILELAGRHLGQVYVLSTVLGEVHGLDAAGCEQLGIRVVEPTLHQVVAAAEKRGRLSLSDHLCLLLARENAWVCVTNDAPLRRACTQEGVTLLWGLEVMLELVRGDQLEPDDALQIARAIHESNPLHITADLVEKFTAKVRNLKR